jgi:hypothetical protein
MTAVDYILGLLEARADHFKWCATTSADYPDQDWTERRSIYKAQAEALNSVAAEIRASLLPPRRDRSLPIVSWLLATEMGGLLTATPFAELSSAVIAKDQFCEKHFIDYQPGDRNGGSAGHACCSIDKITLPPRKTGGHLEVDGRFAVMSYLGDTIETSVFETLEEAQSEVERLKDRIGDEAWIGYHAILYPQSFPSEQSQSC